MSLGFDTDQPPALDEATAVASSTQLDDGPVRVVLDGRPWVVARTTDGPLVAPDRCPHRGAPLSAGTVEDGCLVCPYHGWSFDGDGTLVDIPAIDTTTARPRRAHLPTARAEERDGLVWVDLDTLPPPPAPPALVMGNTDDALRHGWHPVCRSSDVPAGTTVELELIGDMFVVGRAADGTLSCPGVTGVEDHLGHVWIAVLAPVTGLIDLPEFTEDGWSHVAMPRIEGRYGVGLLLDNQLDAGHFSFVHRGTFGSKDDATLPPYEVVRSADGHGFDAHVRVPINARNDVANDADDRPLAQYRRMTYRYQAPTTLFIRLDYEEMGGSTGILFCFTPLDDERSRVDVDLLFRHPDGFTEDQLAERLAFEIAVVAEDMALQDRFDVLALPLTLGAEIHTKADKSAVEMRRIVAAMYDPST